MSITRKRRLSPAGRWLRLLEILEAAGYQDLEFACAIGREPTRWYETRDTWYGVGSAYVRVGMLDSLGYEVEITVRMFDYAPVAGGGLRYSNRSDDFERAGDADVSIHPGSRVTLRNVARVVGEKLAAAVAEMEGIRPGPSESGHPGG